jgi:hypothetical protein
MKIIILAALIFISSFSFADGWSGEATVEGIYTLGESKSIIKLSSFKNPDNCQTNADAGHMSFSPTEQKTFFAMFLAAYASGSKVNVYVTGCTPTWNITFARVSHVRMVK